MPDFASAFAILALFFIVVGVVALAGWACGSVALGLGFAFASFLSWLANTKTVRR